MASTAGGNLFRALPVPWGLKARPGRGFPPDGGVAGGARGSLGKLRAVIRNLGLSRNNISPAGLFGAPIQAARDLQIGKEC